MAKVYSSVKFSGSIGEWTFVQSRAYGYHARAKRGTYKKTGVNDAFKKSSSLLMRANKYAKVMQDVINPYRGIAVDGEMWSRLVSLFRTELGKHDTIDLQVLMGFNFSKNHLSTHMSVYGVEVERQEQICVALQFRQPRFAGVDNVTRYRVSVIGLFVSLSSMEASSEMFSCDYAVNPKHDIITLQGALASHAADTLLIVVKCQAIIDNVLSNAEAGVGMSVVCVEKVGMI